MTLPTDTWLCVLSLLAMLWLGYRIGVWEIRREAVWHGHGKYELYKRYYQFEWNKELHDELRLHRRVNDHLEEVCLRQREQLRAHRATFNAFPLHARVELDSPPIPVTRELPVLATPATRMTRALAMPRADRRNDADPT